VTLDRRHEPAAPSGAAASSVALPDEERELWDRLRAGDDPGAHGSLVERYVPYAHRVAARLYARYARDEIEFDEYEQFAMVGLLESIRRFVPGLGASFKTFAAARIQGAVMNGLERLTERRQQAAARRRLLAERTASLVPERLPLEPTERMLRELGDIGVRVALGLILEAIGLAPGARDALPQDAYGRMELRELHRQLWATVERLGERERAIIDLHYGRSMRFEEIARTLRLSKGRVSQLHRQAIARLRTLISKAQNCDIAY
jgi:RNA polymerase sigma factor for flagellar operon FliA